MNRRIALLSFVTAILVVHGHGVSRAAGFDPDLRFRAIGLLRQGLHSEEFWPSMHAAEGLTRAGFGDAVIYALKPRLPEETDDQRRCGLAREQIRAGRGEPVQVMAAILNDPDSNGHIHACESLFKVNRVGDLAALERYVKADDPILRIMAAAALARQGERSAMAVLREILAHEDLRPRRTAAWVLGQIGGEQDWAPIRTLAEAETEPLSKSFYWNALARLGAPGARDRVVQNLQHEDSAVRTYAAETLGVCGEPSHLPLLEAMFDDPHADAGYRAAEAIVRITGRMLEEDQDGDGIPDAIETELGTLKDSPEPLRVVYTNNTPPVLPEGADPEGQANMVRDLAACHVGQNRYLFRIRFHRPVSELRTVFHLYTHLDGNAETGRRSEGWNHGVDVMYSFVDAKIDPRIFTPDIRVNSLMPIRGIVAGDVIWISDDITPLTRDNRAIIEARTLTERYPYERCPEKKGRGTGPHTIELPLQPDRPVPEIEFPRTNHFHMLPPDYQLRHQLRRAATTVHLPLSEARSSGVIRHYNGEFEVRGAAGRVDFSLAVAGRYALALYGNALGAGVSGLHVHMNGRLLGSIATPRVSGPGTLFYSDPLAIAPDSTLSFTPMDSSAPGRFGQVMLIQREPELPAMRIEHLDSAILPARPGEPRDRIQVVWTTTYPATCDITVRIPGQEARVFAEDILSPQVVHRFFLPEWGDAADVLVTVRTQPDDMYPAVEESLTVRTSRKLSDRRSGRARVRLTVTEPTDSARTQWPVTSGVLLAEGVLFDASRCRIEDAGGRVAPAQFRCLARWPDGSIKWLLIDFLAATRAQSATHYDLQLNVDPPIDFDSAVEARDDGHVVTVRNHFLTLKLDRNDMDLFAGIENAAGQPLLRPGSGLRLIDSMGQAYTSLGTADELLLEEDGPVRATVLMRGPLRDGRSTSFMRYLCRLHIYAGSPFVQADVTLENDVIEPEMNRLRSLSVHLGLPGDLEAARFGAGSGRSLLQDYDNRCLIDGIASDTARAKGICSLPAKSLDVTVRDFWQQYPKGFRVLPDGLLIDLLPPLPEDQYCSEEDRKLFDRLYFWCDRGEYKLRTGVRITTTLAVRVGDPADPIAFADHFQNPLYAMCTPAHYCASNAFGPLTPRNPRHFQEFERNLDNAFAEFLQRRETVREYGFMNYGDWYGERTWNWGNIEYDTQHALALNFVRGGNLDMLRRAAEAEEHNADIDTVHWDRHPERIGQVYTHCLGHTGKYFDADFKGMGAGFANGPRSTGHAWSRGHFALWALTGNERYRETGEKVAYYQGALAARNPGLGFSRGGGWSLIGVTGAYQMTGDPFYLNAARVLVRRILEKQRPNGQWGHTIWECRDEFPRPWGSKPFMTGVIMHGLAMYDRIEPTPDVKDALVRAARYLWDHTYVRKDHGFVYAEAPRFMNRGGIWTLNLNGDGLARACAISPSREQKRLLVDALSHNHYRAGISSFGKTFTQGLCFSPYMLAELTALGITNPPPVEDGPAASLRIRRHIALPPGQSFTLTPVCQNRSGSPLRCRLTLPWNARRFVQGSRRVSWQAPPGVSSGPPMTFLLPSEPGVTSIDMTVRYAGQKETRTLVLEAVESRAPGSHTAWVTAPGDHLAKAATTLGIKVKPIANLAADSLADVGAVVLGAEAFNKHMAGCDTAYEVLLRFAAAGGMLVVGQLNDSGWDPSFLPLDIALSNDSSTSAEVLKPDHPLFGDIDATALAGVTCYDTITYVAPEWEVLMVNADGHPAILEGCIGRGRVVVLMPSFDRVVNEKGPGAQACGQLLTNLFRYASVHGSAGRDTDRSP